MKNKAVVRQMLLDTRGNLSPEQREQAALSVAFQLAALAPLKTATTVMTYAPFRTELNPNIFFDLAPTVHASGTIRTVFPRVTSDTEMQCFACAPADLEPGFRSIHEPHHGADEVPNNELDVILVPGVGFDYAGYRIGYGAGYYDRFLASILAESANWDRPRPTFVGITFDECLAESVLPDTHDIPVGYIVTPTTTIQCRKR